MRTTVQQAIYLVGRGNGPRWLVVGVLALVASGFEVLGAALVFVLLALVADPEAEIDLPVVGDIRGVLGQTDGEALLLGVIVAMFAFFVLRACLQVGNVYVQKRMAHNIGARLAVRLFAGYLSWPYVKHLNRNSSELLRNARGAVDSLVGEVITPAIRVITETFLLLGLLGLLVSVSPIGTLLGVIVLGGAATSLLILVQPRLKRLGRASHQLYGESLKLMHEPLEGLRDVKLLGREAYFAREFGRARSRLARVLYRRAAIAELPHSVMELSVLGFILLFFGVTLRMGDAAQSALPVLGLFAYAGMRLQPSIQHVIKGLNALKFSEAPIADLYVDLREIEALPPPETDVAPLRLQDRLRFEGVGFRYPGANDAALSGVDLTIRPGDAVGICGPTGGGKTTMLDLMTGLLEPTEGRVSVDGLDLRDNTRAWQSTIGVVPQAPFLLDDTLRRNVALGDVDDEIDDDAVREAVALAQLTDFVSSLPKGLETRVGERGVRLSGGQRQRIAIARALYRRPDVLLFDEGTSALDNLTEAALMESIDRLRGDHTVVLVAHRLSTVRKSDQVIFIEGGRITGAGTYDALLRDHPAFRALAGAT